MGDIVVFNNVTLDGVMQAPGRSDEDVRDGFRHGGWAVPYADEVAGRVAAEGFASTAGLLLGRRTYEDFHGFWPHQRDSPFSDALNAMPKYVVSTTLHDPLPWQNSVLVNGDVVSSVRALKARVQGDLAVLGSGVLLRTLVEHGLVDRYILLLHPLVLGTGRRLFPDGWERRLSLAGVEPTSTGVLIATYHPHAA